jgi:putative membrane protein
MMIVFWAVFIGLIVWVVREVNGRNAASDSRALDILKERYAKGDISKEEFESKKRDIA